jgi:uncharacterized protein (DUF362 family)/ferredoxin
MPNVSLYKCSTKKDIKETIDKILINSSLFSKCEKKDLILLKPNFCNDMPYSTGATTDLRILRYIIEDLRAMGFDNVVIGEGSSAGFAQMRIDVLDRLGVKKFCKLLDVRLIDFNFTEAVERKLDTGTIVKIPKIIFEVKYIINLPVLKTHIVTGMTGGIKNIGVGCVAGIDKAKIHYNLNKNIVSVFSIVKPDLTIVDALIGMEGNAPSLGNPRRLNLLIASGDTVAADAIAAKIIGLDARNIDHIYLAYQNELGVGDIDKLVVSGENLEAVQTKFKDPKLNFLGCLTQKKFNSYLSHIRFLKPVDWFVTLDVIDKFLLRVGIRQDIINKKINNCHDIYKNITFDNCKEALEICPMDAITNGKINQKLCIQCSNCLNVCNMNAIDNLST